jgi:hypothetical protein
VSDPDFRSGQQLAPRRIAVTELQSRGRSVEAVALSGEPFWATVEIALCEPLLIATEKLLVS